MGVDGWTPDASFLDGLEQWQHKTLTPAPFEGTVACDAGNCEQHLWMMTPGVRFVVVWHS